MDGKRDGEKEVGVLCPLDEWLDESVTVALAEWQQSIA